MQIELLKMSALSSLIIKSNSEYLNQTKMTVTKVVTKVISKIDPIQGMNVTKIDFSNLQFIKASLLQQQLVALGLLSLEKKKRKLQKGLNRRQSQETQSDDVFNLEGIVRTKDDKLAQKRAL